MCTIRTFSAEKKYWSVKNYCPGFVVYLLSLRTFLKYNRRLKKWFYWELREVEAGFKRFYLVYNIIIEYFALFGRGKVDITFYFLLKLLRTNDITRVWSDAWY